jgi:hypothetical protein
VTPDQLAQLEAARERREDELVLLLLLLIAFGVQRSEGAADRPATLASVIGQRAAAEMAESMADMHTDAFPIYRPGLSVPDREELVRLYSPTARVATDAMLDTIAAAIVAAGGDVALGLRTAGYSRSNTAGLELGAERNIVTASNAGLLAAAVGTGERVTGLEHLSVIDDATTDICRPRNRLRLPTLDAYWRRNWPSLHWRCRSIVVPLTGEFEAGSSKGLPSPLPGFGVAPPVVLQMLDRVAGRSSAGRAA